VPLIPADPPQATQPEPLPKKKRSWGKIVTIILLALALIGALVLFALAFLKLEEANTRIDEQDRQIEEQQELIEKKETFGAAMEELIETARRFDGVRMTEIVPYDQYQNAATRAWSHRWEPDALDNDIEAVKTATAELQTLLDGAAAEASSNTTGTAYESTTDQLGLGFVTSVVEDADTLCESDVLACVLHDDPYTVHFDAGDNGVEYMTDWLRTGIAYHEFAHVLQMTNPGPTETAAASFGGDWETMADCFALTYLPGWTLDHTIWVSSFQYWEVSIGYGYTCDAPQMQVIRDWYEPLGFSATPISQ